MLCHILGALFSQLIFRLFADIFTVLFNRWNVNRNQTAERPLNLPTMKERDKGSFKAAPCICVQSAETCRAETLDCAGRPVSAELRKRQIKESSLSWCQMLAVGFAFTL